MDEYAAFAAIYEDWASHMTEDVPFYLELVRQADGPVVELAVGNGRVAIPVAKETGKRIVGIDRSPAMLALAREALPMQGSTSTSTKATCASSSSTSRRRSSTARSVRSSICRRGRTSDGSSSGSPPRCNRAGVSCGTRSSSTRRSPRRTTGSGTSTPGSSIASTTRRPTTGSTSPSSPADKVSLWWATRSEWEGLVDVSGLETEALYGDFERTPFDETSGEFVWVARKPG